MRLLLADDNAVHQKVGLMLLKRLGYTADVVANGLEVLQAIEAKAYVSKPVRIEELTAALERWGPKRAS